MGNSEICRDSDFAHNYAILYVNKHFVRIVYPQHSVRAIVHIHFDSQANYHNEVNFSISRYCARNSCCCSKLLSRIIPVIPRFYQYHGHRLQCRAGRPERDFRRAKKQPSLHYITRKPTCSLPSPGQRYHRSRNVLQLRSVPSKVMEPAFPVSKMKAPIADFARGVTDRSV